MTSSENWKDDKFRKLTDGKLFEDAGDYVVVVGVGDFGALEGHYKGNKNRSSRFAEG